MLTARSVKNNAANFAFKDFQNSAAARGCENADETRLAAIVGNVSELAKQAGVVGCVGVERGVGRIWIVGGVACGAHTGSTPERGDFESGIIGKHELATRGA